jgi:hypothetical protein
MQNWWAQGWIWASLVLFIAIIVVMSVYASPYYGGLRKAAGLPYMEKMKIQTPQPSVSDEELAKMLESPRGVHAALIGWAGLLVILALMMFKPF